MMRDASTPRPDRPPPGGGFERIDRGRTLEVETPEHVRIDFDLAGVGSRSMAVIADLTIIIATILLLILVAGLIGPQSELVGSIGGAWLLFIVFLLQSGYFFLWELFAGGRTPGKRMVGLRVVSSDATPITLRGAALRNVVRVVDLQPVFSGMVGLGMIATTSRAQRLGDIIGGTVVVRDREGSEIPEARVTEIQTGRPRLSAGRFELLDRYMERRDSLSPEARRKISSRVMSAIAPELDRRMDSARTSLDDQLAIVHAEERARQSGGLSPQAVRLFADRRDDWARFDALVSLADRHGLAGLSQAELEMFTTLYRQVGADLARARTYGGSLRLRFDLERRVVSGHNLFYRGRGAPRGALDWIRYTLPAEFRRNRAFLVASAILLFGPAFGTYATIRLDPSSGAEIASPVLVQRAEAAAERLETGEGYIDVPQATMPMFSSRIMTNNLRVAITTVAGGILAGLGTLAILVFNGINIGSAFAVYDNVGAGSLLWEFVLPHGVIELTAIVIAGAGGLMIGSALLMPGRMTRSDALRRRGAVAIGLLGGSLVLLVIAGLIEGYVSPAEIPTGFKYGFSALVAALTFLYLGFSGRENAGAADGEVRAGRAP